MCDRRLAREDEEAEAVAADLGAAAAAAEVPMARTQMATWMSRNETMMKLNVQKYLQRPICWHFEPSTEMHIGAHIASL